MIATQFSKEIFHYYRLEAETTVIRKQEIKDGDDLKFAAEVLVRKIPEDQEVRMAEY